jgi:hypothetical protein
MAGLEIVGALPGDWEAQISAFVDAAAHHPWGGEVSDRLVVAANIPAALEKWMKPEEWAEKAAQYDSMVGATGGKAFIAQDGQYTAVVPALPDQAVFLTLAGHELLESAGKRRAVAEGYGWPGATIAGLAHLIRTEYVVERTRRAIADRLGWPQSALEQASLAATARDIAVELPELLAWAVANEEVPQRIYQHWGELMLAWGGQQGARMPAMRAHVPISSRSTATSSSPRRLLCGRSWRAPSRRRTEIPSGRSPSSTPPSPTQSGR